MSSGKTPKSSDCACGRPLLLLVPLELLLLLLVELLLPALLLLLPPLLLPLVKLLQLLSEVLPLSLLAAAAAALPSNSAAWLPSVLQLLLLAVRGVGLGSGRLRHRVLEKSQM